VRVLVVHNRYRSALPSGENEVVASEIESLRASGIDVDTYFRSSDEIENFNTAQRAALSIRPIYSVEDTHLFRRQLRDTRPNVVHLHNPFPLISPWIIKVAKAEGVPVVQTVHNYRHSCPAGKLFRDGAVCEECSGKALPWPAVVHGCYRGSRSQSAVMASSARIHRSTWLSVDHFLAVSGFVAEHLTKAGVSQERISVRYNSTQPRGPTRPLGTGFVFVGRLSDEKGASLLISAWMQADLGRRHRLVVAGDGPERDLVVSARDHNVHYVGLVDRARVSALLDEAAVVVIPSLNYEGFPRLVAESFERGRPVAATALGALKELITPEVGWTAPPEPDAFAKMMVGAASDPSLTEKGARARATYESRLDPVVTTSSLLDIYERVQAGRSAPVHHE
jgi:glycosyltransferase involved in cell wall biosynthesis